MLSQCRNLQSRPHFEALVEISIITLVKFLPLRALRALNAIEQTTHEKKNEGLRGERQRHEAGGKREENGGIFKTSGLVLFKIQRNFTSLVEFDGRKESVSF